MIWFDADLLIFGAEIRSIMSAAGCFPFVSFLSYLLLYYSYGFLFCFLSFVLFGHLFLYLFFYFFICYTRIFSRKMVFKLSKFIVIGILQILFIPSFFLSKSVCMFFLLCHGDISCIVSFCHIKTNICCSFINSV